MGQVDDAYFPMRSQRLVSRLERISGVQKCVVNMWTTSRMPPFDTGNCRAALEFKIPCRKEVEVQGTVRTLYPG